MEHARPSRTALRVAMRRAAHQLYDAHPLVLDDPIAVAILGPHAVELERTPGRNARHKPRPFSIALRAFLVARSRYAENLLAQAVEHGVNQYVLLGAGLDTFAHRNPYPQLRVFEVDHPATHEWKRELLLSGTLSTPANLAYAPVDFEHQSLAEQLHAAGFDSAAPTLFAWLGVVPYLTRDAFRSTLNFISSQPPGSGVVFDYGQPRAVLPPLRTTCPRLARLAGPTRRRGVPTLLHPGRSRVGVGHLPRSRRHRLSRDQRALLRGAKRRSKGAWQRKPPSQRLAVTLPDNPEREARNLHLIDKRAGEQNTARNLSSHGGSNGSTYFVLCSSSVRAGNGTDGTEPAQHGWANLGSGRQGHSPFCHAAVISRCPQDSAGPVKDRQVEGFKPDQGRSAKESRFSPTRRFVDAPGPHGDSGRRTRFGGKGAPGVPQC